MHTIFISIDCVEQLTFFKIFVDHLQFEQSLIFCLKVKLLKIHVRQMIFNFWPVVNFFDICSNGVEQLYFCVEQFFELLQFEQLNITLVISSKITFSKTTSKIRRSYFFLTKWFYLWILEWWLCQKLFMAYFL